MDRTMLKHLQSCRDTQRIGIVKFFSKMWGMKKSQVFKKQKHKALNLTDERLHDQRHFRLLDRGYALHILVRGFYNFSGNA